MKGLVLINPFSFHFKIFTFFYIFSIDLYGTPYIIKSTRTICNKGVNNMSKPIYIRTDKNGTKIYHDYTCQRCGGVGGASQWQFTGYTCYECGGTGESRKPQIIKEYTKEYEAKLAERAKKRAEKRLAEQLHAFNENRLAIAEAHGFNSNGKIYVVALADTFKIKDELKEAGAMYRSGLNWYFLTEQEHFQTIEIDYEECLNVYPEHGTMAWKNLSEIKEVLANKLPQIEEKSEYVGSIGDKVEFAGTFVRSTSYEIPSFRGFGTDLMFIHIFRDENENCFIWKTSRCFNIEEGKQVRVKGTIKAHEEYKDTKQTILQRCKVNEI